MINPETHKQKLGKNRLYNNDWQTIHGEIIYTPCLIKETDMSWVYAPRVVILAQAAQQQQAHMNGISSLMETTEMITPELHKQKLGKNRLYGNIIYTPTIKDADMSWVFRSADRIAWATTTSVVKVNDCYGETPVHYYANP